jgi:tRNA(fMet)-specific endonuclease VapC
VSLFVLDTDHVSLLQRAHPVVAARVLAAPPDELAVSVITFEEQLGAWYAQIRQARDREKLTRAYEGLFQILEDAKRVRILPFSRPAIDRYLALRRVHRRVERMDLAIAAIVIEAGAVLVTRNRSDFELIEGIALQDWSLAE